MCKDQAQSDTGTPVSRHFNFAEGSYLESTSRPLYALLFLLPLLALYELGTLLVNTDQIAHTQARVAAFTWLMDLAEWIGVDHSLAWAFPGFVVVIVLLCWHMSSHYPWRIRFRWLGGMAIESVLLCIPLLVLNAALGSSTAYSAAAAAPQNHYLANIVTSIGAGIYEELMFRLILMGLMLMLLEDVLKIKTAVATTAAVLLSAVLFALHHYIGLDGANGVAFSWVSFLFYSLAGVYFAAVFHYRGYGIIAGTHAAYNVVLYSTLG